MYLLSRQNTTRLWVDKKLDKGENTHEKTVRGNARDGITVHISGLQRKQQTK